MPKLTPLGSSDFKGVIEQNMYYVDKTAMVRAVVEGAKVQLYCRPRRFGKTLNLSTLRYFFDCRGEHRHLFDGLAVAQDEEMMTLHQGKYPVITLSFKDVKARSYTSAMQAMTTLLYNEWARHTCLENSPGYDEHLTEMAVVVRTGEVKAFLFRDAIMRLAHLLHAHHDAPVLLLIDEYDTPLVEAWLKGYYDDMIEFMRPLLGGVFKDNDEVLFKGVLTGILRVAKESLFSGLNNFISEAGLAPAPSATSSASRRPRSRICWLTEASTGERWTRCAPGTTATALAASRSTTLGLYSTMPSPWSRASCPTG